MRLWSRLHLNFIAFIFGLVLTASASAQTFETVIGPIETEFGTPTNAAAQRLYDEMDLGNARLAYIWGMPAVGTAGFFTQFKEVFGAEQGQFIAHISVADRRGYHTPNNLATYVLAVADLNATGPLVFEDPAGNTAGNIFDLWQRAVAFTGVPGPFEGKGGKFLILGPGQKDPGVDGYEVVHSPTNHVYLGTRLLDRDIPTAVREVAPKMQAYPLAQADNPPEKPLILAEDRTRGQQPPRDIEFFRRLADMLRDEPVAERDRFIMAILQPLGIEAGKPFEPDARRMRILTDAAALGYRTLRAAVDQRRKTPPYWEGRQWKDGVNISPDQRNDNYDELEERGLIYHEIFGTAVPSTGPGTGSKYMVTFRDADGDLLDGGKTYGLHVPPDVPIVQFWSVTAYDVTTRSFIQGTERVGLGPQQPGYEINADGSVDIFFGPEPPEGREANWVQTRSGEGWFSYFRLFGPTEPFFDKSWVLPDFAKKK